MAFSVVYFCTALISMVVQIGINALVLILVVLVNKTNKQTKIKQTNQNSIPCSRNPSKPLHFFFYCACASRDVTGFEKSRK